MPHGAKPQPENQEKPPLTSAEVRGPNGVRGLQHTIAWSVGGKEQQEQLPIVPNFQIQSFIRPKHNIRPIPNLPLFSEYVSYMWFEYNGRLLTQEECHSLMRMVFYEHEYPLENNLFERAFRTPNVVAVALQDVDDALKQEWIRQVGRWFDKLRDNDTTAKYRAEALRGVIGRLPYMQAVPDKLELGGRVLEHYEVYINYGVVNWCKDSNNNGFAEPDTRQIFAYHYNVSSETEFDLSAKLAKPKLKFTQKVARVVNQYIPVFKLAAERMVEKFEVEVLALPRRTGTQAASGSDLAATTDDFASMAVTASASGSRHRTAPAPRPGSPSMEWDDFEEPTEAPPPLSETSGNDPTKPYQLTKHEAEKHFKPMGVQPAPSESGSNDPTGTNKGKTRERDPSSSSPEEEASGQKKKPDAKKPRRAGRLR